MDLHGVEMGFNWRQFGSEAKVLQAHPLHYVATESPLSARSEQELDA